MIQYPHVIAPYPFAIRPIRPTALAMNMDPINKAIAIKTRQWSFKFSLTEDVAADVITGASFVLVKLIVKCIVYKYRQGLS